MCAWASRLIKRKHVEILSGLIIIVCTVGYWQFETLEKNMIVILAVLLPWSGVPPRYVQQSENLFMGLLLSADFSFVCFGS